MEDLLTNDQIRITPDEAVRVAAAAAAAKSGTDPVAIDVSARLPLTDAFLLVSGRSERMVLAVADAVDERLSAAGVPLLRREGKGQGRWELLDFGLVIVHVFHEEDRAYYGLERLWLDCPVIPLPQPVTAGVDTAD
ncbi:ribosome silencing factor [uncultured Amnibacterium sp.]|uniref:ribosome silencing factor n=1 Tax=uncultured Amnibacterium sp. TaxID=1631851 RepID=UPI0035CBCB89